MLKPVVPKAPTTFSAVDAYGVCLVAGMGLYGSLFSSKCFPPAAVRGSAANP
jgi:hypothetical protein